jgi:hypothetical protein
VTQPIEVRIVTDAGLYVVRYPPDRWREALQAGLRWSIQDIGFEHDSMGVLAGIVLEQAKKDGVLPKIPLPAPLPVVVKPRITLPVRKKTWLEKFADAARSLIGGGRLERRRNRVAVERSIDAGAGYPRQT